MNFKKEIGRIEDQIHDFRQKDMRVFATSSFQTHSIPLVHIISRIDNSIPIYFNNTGFHFPETLQFKDEIGARFKIDILETRSHIPKSEQKDAKGNLLFTSDPDYCCFLNKVSPIEPVLMQHDVWINGIRAVQNSNRRNMKEVQEAPFDTMRYHPLLNWSNKMIFNYIKAFDLPKHPLEKKGYLSVGCEPCTSKFFEGNSRNARWFGLNKTECGLHTELVRKQ